MEPLVNEDSGKTAGIVSYFSIIGWLIAYFGMHQNNKTSIGSYQLRQTLLLYIVTVGIWIVYSFVLSALLFSSFGLFWFASLLNFVIWAGVFVLWLIGLIGAINGQQKPIPVIGNMAQKMFAGI
jgi:uncharacterized membrane protein